MKFSKFLSLFLALVMMITLLTACNPSATDTGTTVEAESTAETETEADADAPPEEVELRFVWWGGEARHTATLAAIDLYMEENPHVTIVGEYVAWDGYYQKIVTQLAGGAAPDIIQIVPVWFYDLSSQGDLFLDIYEQEEIDLSVFDEAFLKTNCEYDGKLQGVPTGIMADTLVYNKEFFETHGIAEDTVWTWDMLVDVGGQINSDDPNSYLMHTSPTFVRYYLRQILGTDEVNEETYTPNFTVEMATEAFTLLREMYDSGAKLPAEDKLTTQQSDEHIKWQQGETGLFFTSTSMISKIKSNSPFEIGVARTPIIEEGTSNTGIEVLPSQLFSINAQTDYPEEAAKFLNWLSTDEDAILTLGDSRGIPPTTMGMEVLEAAGKLDPLIIEGTNMAMAEAGMKVNSLSDNQELYDILVTICEKVAFDKATPEDAAVELLDKYNDKLAQLKEAAE